MKWLKTTKLISMSILMILSFSTSAFAQNTNDLSSEIDPITTANSISPSSVSPLNLSPEEIKSIVEQAVPAKVINLDNKHSVYPYYDMSVYSSKLYIPQYTLGGASSNTATLVSDSRFYPDQSGKATLTFTQWNDSNWADVTVTYFLMNEKGQAVNPQKVSGQYKGSNYSITFSGLTNQLYAVAIINNSSSSVTGNLYVY